MKKRRRSGGTALISLKEIRHLAWLAKIELSRREEASLQKELGKIVKYFRKIDEAATEDIPPTFHVLDMVNVLRPDYPGPGLEREKVLELAPNKKAGYIKAPRMG